MKVGRMLLLAVVGSVVSLAVPATAALAQTPVDPSATPLKNESATAPITPFGIHVSFATLLLLLGLAMVLFLTIMYMRYAPRFSKDEESLKVVRADRVVVGQELPAAQRRPVAGGPGDRGPPRGAQRARRAPAAAPAAPAAVAARLPCTPPSAPAAPTRHPPPLPRLPLRRCRLRLPPPRQPPPRRLPRPRNGSRSRWTKRSSTPRWRNCSTPAPIVGSLKARLAAPAMIAAKKKAAGEA